MASRCLAQSVLRSYITPLSGRCKLITSVARTHVRPVGVPTAPSAGTRAQRMFCRAAEASGGGGSGGSTGRLVGSGGSGQPHRPDGSSGLWALYLSWLEAYPLLTKALTCGLLNALGDIFCQLFVEGGSWNAKRTATFTFMGMLLVGPTLHFWYSMLNKFVPARGTGGVLLQLFLDQFVFAPAFLATFLSVLLTVEGVPHLIRGKLERDWFETVKVNWYLWIPAQFFNFRFVPPHLQVLTANIVALAWNTYMSFQSHKGVAHADSKH